MDLPLLSPLASQIQAHCGCQIPECSLQIQPLSWHSCWVQHTPPTANNPQIKQFSQSANHTETSDRSAAHLVIIILRRASGIKSQVQTPGPRNVHCLLAFVIVSDWVHTFHCFPRSPRGWNFETSQESLLLFVQINAEMEPVMDEWKMTEEGKEWSNYLE